MKIIYCIHSVYNPGGMERVLLNKVSYLACHTGWDVSVVTTDQKGRPPFYPFPAFVSFTDLGVNYSDDNGKNPLLKTLGYLKRRRAHKKLLARHLMEQKADTVVSLYPGESSFLPSIKDGSRKVLELHQNRFFHLQYNRKGLLGLSDRFRSWTDTFMVRKFDRFVVLTEEDKSYWGDLKNIEAIPNAVRPVAGCSSDVSAKRVIAVGRLDYQKGFDRLVDAWSLAMADDDCRDWKLDIFGKGEWKGLLERKISELGLTSSIRINEPSSDIFAEYAASSMLVMSSHYEGFPMVMVEAMSCGLPAVTFDFISGPKDIIDSGRNGLVVRDGDIAALADAMKKLMKDEPLRRSMSDEARKVVSTYSEDAIMKRWMDLFDSLTR